MMRKPRDYDAELKALDGKARQLRERKVKQLGELVIACAADTMSIEQLAGVLVTAVENENSDTKEAWLDKGAAFFQKKTRAAAKPRAAAIGPDKNSGDA